MFDALHHAREHLTPEMALYTLHLLADSVRRRRRLGRRVTDLVDSRRIWIVPMVNPDGLVYDLGGGHFGDGAYRGWRKNRQPTPGSSQVGTDLNRNYGYGWTGGGSHGPSPTPARTPSPRPRRAPSVTSSAVGGRAASSASGPTSRSTPPANS